MRNKLYYLSFFKALNIKLVTCLEQIGSCTFSAGAESVSSAIFFRCAHIKQLYIDINVIASYPDHHQRSPSPEYWLFPLNSISHHPVPDTDYVLTCSLLPEILKPLSHTHSSRSLVLPQLTFLSITILSIRLLCAEMETRVCNLDSSRT